MPSTTVTSEPNFFSAHPNSSPIYPPPTIATFLGSFSKLNAPVEERTNSSSHGMKGKSIWEEPVAIITFSASILISPFSVLTVQFFEEENVAQPWINSAPAFLTNVSTPLVNL